MSHASPAAPCFRYIPTELFCKMWESCTPPRKWETTVRRWFWELQMSWTFMEWYCLQLRYGNRSGEGALTCMQSIALMVLGRPAVEWNPPRLGPVLLLYMGILCIMWTVDLFHPWLRGRVWLMDVCDMPTLSPSSLWSVPRWRVFVCVVVQGLTVWHGPAVLVTNYCNTAWGQLLVA